MNTLSLGRGGSLSNEIPLQPLLDAVQTAVPEVIREIIEADIGRLFALSNRKRREIRKNLRQHPVGQSDYGRLLSAVLDCSLGQAAAARRALEDLFITREQQSIPDAWLLYGLAHAQALLGNYPGARYYLQVVGQDLPEWNFPSWQLPSSKTACQGVKLKELSLCMIVKNEESRLNEALGPLLGICDQVVVVDTGSSDHTVNLATSLGAEVYSFPWTGSFAEARNFALSKATGRWILIFDADMKISLRDSFVIKSFLQKPGIEGCFMPVLNFTGSGQELSYVRDLIFILFRNRAMYRYDGKVHEQVVPSILRTKPKARFEICPALIHHYGYLEAAKKELGKGRRNLNLLAAEREPSNGFKSYALAVEALQQGRFCDALALLRQSAAGMGIDEARQSDILAKIVECLLQLGRWEEAEQEILRAIPRYPLYTDLYFVLAQLCLNQNRLAEGEAVLNVCLRRGVPPAQHSSLDGCGTFRAHLLLGQLYLTLGLKNQASSHLAAALGDSLFTNPEAALEQILPQLTAGEGEPAAMLNGFIPSGHRAEDGLQKVLEKYANRYIQSLKEIMQIL